MAKANKEGTCKFKVDTFKKLIKKKGLTMQDISLGIGKNRDYIASCCRQGKISNKSRLEIRRKFNIKLIVEKEITDMEKCICDMCGKVESNSIKDILSTLITDMAVNGATFDELALVTKMSKDIIDIIDILDDYDYREFKRKYQENRTMETMEDKTLYLIVRPTFPKWEDGILDEYISLVGIFDSEKASNQICDENDKVFEVKLNHIYPVDITGGNFNPEEILIGGAWRDKG